MQKSQKQKFNPKENYAITTAKIVTIHEGKRVVKQYHSGEKLLGKIAEGRYAML